MTPALTRIESDHLAVVFTDEGGIPSLAWIGPADAHPTLETLTPPTPRATLDRLTPVGLVAEGAGGRRPGLVGSRSGGKAWSPRFSLTQRSAHSDRVRYELTDPLAALELGIEASVGPTLVIELTLTNNGDTPYRLDRLAPTLPVPEHLGELITFAGRWCREFQPERSEFRGLTLIENRRGRTSHQRLPALFALETGANETWGEVIGIQLAWSGNYEIAAEHTAEGDRILQAGELLWSGEVELAPGESYTSPEVVLAWSDRGIGPASHAFHDETRRRLPTDTGAARPIVLNTWEAVYFDHDLDVLTELATRAARVGVERFVLDDGWFGGRRNDRRGLGDWWVSPEVWPDGLEPLISTVHRLGMDFGLWVEPEMVNPDSELFRQHPDWALVTEGYDAPLARNQLVLDLGRDEVLEHLFGQLDQLLTDNDIAYLKWDMNRDLVQASGAGGQPGTRAHVLGVYRLIDRLRAAHPGVEIESCASGGGRADLGILGRTDRVWVSDCNDALERQLIQRGFSMLFPASVAGAHVGPPRSHTTGRRHELSLRLATALFGHLGIEWNLLDADEAELDELARALGAYKRLRSLLHGGRTLRIEHPDPALLTHAVIAPDQSSALVAMVQMSSSADMIPAPVRIPGLDPAARYRVRALDELARPTGSGVSDPDWLSEGTLASGRHLSHRGMRPPIMHPEQALVIELERVDR